MGSKTFGKMKLCFSFLVLSRGFLIEKKNEIAECISGYEPPKPDLVELAKSYLDPESGGIGVWDGHNDLPMTYTYHDTMNQNLDKIDLYDSTLNFTETTIPWAKEGHLRGQFWSIYWS